MGFGCATIFRHILGVLEFIPVNSGILHILEIPINITSDELSAILEVLQPRPSTAQSKGIYVLPHLNAESWTRHLHKQLFTLANCIIICDAATVTGKTKSPHWNFGDTLQNYIILPSLQRNWNEEKQSHKQMGNSRFSVVLMAYCDATEYASLPDPLPILSQITNVFVLFCWEKGS